MSKTRDIANFLGRTEAANINNAAMATDSSQLGIWPDDAYVENEINNSGVTALSTLDSLPTSSLTQGKMFFVKDDPRRLYLSTGTGYYNVSTVNTAGTAAFDDSSYSMDSINGTATVVTLAGTDADSDKLSYSFSFIPSNIVDSAITTSISDNVITLTAQDSAGSGTGVYNFKIIGAVSDTVNTFYDSADVQLVFQGTGTLTSSAASVNEGSSVTFNLPTFGWADGTTFPYTITGISGADISQGLTGNMTVSSDVASVTINVVADVTTEGSETITFSADGQSVNVTINDTSTGPTPRATGGTITYDGNDVIHTFTTNGTFTPSTTLSCDYIVVGGGAHGGGWRGGSYCTGSGGGGAGGYLAGTRASTLIASAVSITIGAGSTYTGNTSPSYGGNTVCTGGLVKTAYGGGPGGSLTVYNGSDGGYSGGSGGGGAGNYPSGSYSGGSGTSGQGNAGGTGVNFQSNAYTGGGGGGAGGAGGSSGSRQGGAGGDGISNNISGTAVIYAAGGGGGCLVEQNPPSPVTNAENYRGQGGSSNTGGEGGVAQYMSFGGALGYGRDGQDGTTPGSGGGGAAQHSTSASDAIAGNGADGIVIIRYLGI